MFTIMRNTFCTRAKLAKREAPGRDEDCGALAGSTPAKQEWHLRGRELERAMARLSPASRSIIEMVAIEGETYEAAAARLHCAVGTVKSRLNRARVRLAAELENPGSQ
jgi:RNA polymerase sigma-70 factor (ECF subfamily)